MGRHESLSFVSEPDFEHGRGNPGFRKIGEVLAPQHGMGTGEDALPAYQVRARASDDLHDPRIVAQGRVVAIDVHLQAASQGLHQLAQVAAEKGEHFLARLGVKGAYCAGEGHFVRDNIAPRPSVDHSDGNDLRPPRDW